MQRRCAGPARAFAWLSLIIHQTCVPVRAAAPSSVDSMTTLIDISRCPLRCHDRGACFTWPPEPEFPPICACNELWEGKTCERRQHNPFNARRSSEKAANAEWRGLHGVACTVNETAATCEECGEHRCDAGECMLKAAPGNADAYDCTLRDDKPTPRRPRMSSSLYGKTRGRGRGRGASPDAKGRGAPAKGRGAPPRGRGTMAKGRGAPAKGRGTMAEGRGAPAKGRGAAGRQLRRTIWQQERAQGLTLSKLGRAVAAAHAPEPRHGARRLEAVGAPPRIRARVRVRVWARVRVRLRVWAKVRARDRARDRLRFRARANPTPGPSQAGAPPRVGVCLSGWLGVAVHAGGESLRRC